ncbi:unnamed protein product [Mytilus edulis]|uniref:Uncharacterized protein n=1 Tax=Mytilus edulis TaxID=6550 RepID=A0A8S3SHX0_MYTED|nr:unnamed protein product [Mytilus edulis]
MFRWLERRKERRVKRRQEKHRQILEVLKSKDTRGANSSDYGFYKDDFIYKKDSMSQCNVEHKPHDYEEIDDLSSLPPQFSRIVGMDFRFNCATDNIPQPPQLPARTFSTGGRSVSVSGCRDIANGNNFKERTFSLPSFARNSKFPVSSDDDEEPAEPFYNEPWDRRKNLTITSKRDSLNNTNNLSNVQLRIFEKLNKEEDLSAERNFDLRCSRISDVSNIYSEIEDSDTGIESDAISESGSDCSVFIDNDEQTRLLHGLKQSLQSFTIDREDVSDSDASSGFCEGHSEIDEDHKCLLLKSLRQSQNEISSPSLFRMSKSPSIRFNTYPRTPVQKIAEDSELYLVPKRRHSLNTNRNDKLDLPIQKKKYKMEQRKITHQNRNRLLDDIIWRNNFK